MASSGRKIVFVVGAGASSDVKLPTGKGMTEDIAKALSFKDGKGDDAVRDCIGLQQRSDQSGKQVYWGACRRIVSGMPQAESIDSFIHENRQDEKIEFCGKLAIARCILNAESKSDLYHPNPGHRFDFDRVTGVGETWYDRFFKLLRRDREVHELKDRLESVSMIVFNYDRCIEHYLFHALKNYYGVDDQTSAGLLEQFQIYHPYGTVGKLPWQDNAKPVEYGGDLYLSNLMESAERIRTFTEGARAEEIADLRQDVIAADIIVFLGFAFHDINMKLLRPTEDDRLVARANEPRKLTFATAKGIHHYQQDIATTAIKALSSVDPKKSSIIEDMGCVDLFDRYGKGFSLD